MTKKAAREAELEEFEKAAKKAAKQRDSNRKLREGFRDNKVLQERMRKKLVEDLIRVFNHAANPFGGFAASQKRYRKLGHYPEIFVTDLFGNHQEFERAAGLRASRTTQKAKNAMAKVHAERTVLEYAEEHIVKHFGKWDKQTKPSAGEKHVVVFSDLHSLLVDPFAWEVGLQVLKLVQPDLTVFNGDICDFPRLGRYVKYPGATNLGVQAEIDCSRNKFFRPAREILGDGKPITFHIGNHEQRLIRYIADAAPEIADLNCLAFDKLFGIDEFDIEMVFGGHFLAPNQNDRRDNIKRTWKVYYDCFAVSHGHATSKTAARKEIERFGMSGTSGHTHRPEVVTCPTLVCPTANWTSTGMMASYAVGQHFVNGPSSWTMGFGVFTVWNGIVVPQPVLIHEDFATFAGHVWRPTPAAKKARAKLYD